MRILRCPHCTAPIPPTTHASIRCGYCGSAIVDVPAFPWGESHFAEAFDGRAEDRSRERIWVGKKRYVVLGRLGVGASSGVFLARRDERLSSIVRTKLQRASEDTDLLANEFDILRRLERSRLPASGFFCDILPRPEQFSQARKESERLGQATTLRWKSGFTLSLAELIDKNGSIDCCTSVWIWRRLLETLGWAHRNGIVHGAVTPDHVLLHPRDHGVQLIGWTVAGRKGSPLRAVDSRYRDFYPKSLDRRMSLETWLDISMATRCIDSAVGDASVAGLRALMKQHLIKETKGRSDDAFELSGRIEAAARRAFGGPKFVPLRI